ncbi:hypothetical protein QEH42_gp081 [Microbacterium phage Pumpernickel]|uniref:Uncharacterized protein n=1 Tax=Microbacterium phage Pumpernickel TaxID=2885983 RepID=A0AAE9C2U0_9CAUD|nr:hypothetical protein QEH42_gp081 [Microbacterium phage Pumpernickel]UDL15872.1 hypothetical protein SEA_PUMPERNICKEL_81 [Microbacterium phage Pumpernickel]
MNVEDTRIEIQDLRSGTIIGWIEYEDGEFYASSDEIFDIVKFYRDNGADDQYVISVLSSWSNGLQRAYVVS